MKEGEGAKGAFLVGAGILASRLFGLVRSRVFAYYLGNSDAAGAFTAALRIPNFLQNLLGEGVLSASFIPVYARLTGEKRQEEADQVAGAVFGLLSTVVFVLVTGGVLATPVFIDVIAPGFKGESRELTIQLVRILFPGTGLLVLSAWCLGVLNSHRRFFLSYVAPVLWNLAMIGALLGWGGRTTQAELAAILAWGASLGGLLQLGVMVPPVMRLLGKFRPSLGLGSPHVRAVLWSFGPVVVSRGVVQVSAWVDTAYATLISERAVAALGYAQTLYLIPVSLFGMAISAAELPEMSQAEGTPEEVAEKLRRRLDLGLARIAFFVVPSAAAFLLLGDVVGGAIFQTGKFGAGDTRYLWYILIGSTVGLLAATMGRLYASAFYALRDTRTPLYFAVIRVALTAVTAWLAAVKAPGWLGLPVELGAVGITATTGAAAWLEFALLRRSLGKRIGRTGLSAGRLVALWGAAIVAMAVGIGVKAGLAAAVGTVATDALGGALFPAPALHPVLVAAAVLAPAGLVYLMLTAALGVPQSRALLAKVLRR